MNSLVPPSFAQTAFNLPAPGTVVTFSQPFTPPLVRGITLYPDNPLKFDFIIDVGDDHLQADAFQQESMKLIKYFLVSLTVPENDMWVNLSPYEKDRIVPEHFGKTEMGRDLLLQDYVLKQLTAGLMNPDEKIGAEFWERVYEKAKEEFGTTDIPTDTFNKVWIVPDKAQVYVKGESVYVVDSHLKVMLEEDYVARENAVIKSQKSPEEEAKETSEISKQLIREIIIPEIEREVNEGKNFALLRQIQNSAILAAWYKKNLKQTLLGKVYVDQSKTDGINSEDKEAAQKIYGQYVEAFKKGVYDLIKEDYDPATQEIIPRKYFSGGIIEANEKLVRSSDSAVLAEEQLTRLSSNPVREVTWGLNADSAMLSQESQVKSRRGRSVTEEGKRLRQWAERKKGQKVDETQGEIAERYSVSVSTVSRILEKYGIESPGVEAQANAERFRQWAKRKRGQKIDQTQGKIAEQYSVSRGTIRKIFEEYEIESPGVEAQANAEGLRKWAEGKKGQKVDETQEEIAERYGVTGSTVGKIFKEYKIESPGMEAKANTERFRQWAAGKRKQRSDQLQKEIAKQYGVSSSTIGKIMGEFGIEAKWGEKENIKRLREWAREKQGDKLNQIQKDIAKEYGVSPGTVSNIMREYAIKTKQSRPRDRAMMSKNVGGIDLNANEKTLVEQGEKIELPVSLNPSDLQNFQTNGFIPVIINIAPPTSLPAILGLSQTNRSKQLSHL